jgi:hypothetical protein
MKTLRINLHIRNDVSPKLYEALAHMPPRPRAEYLRKVAEFGLQVTTASTHVSSTRTGDLTSISKTTTTDSVKNNFSNDLVGLLGNDLNQ